MSKKQSVNGDCSPEEFVRTWQQATSSAAVAAALGVSRQAVQARAHRYRQAGIPLKRMFHGPEPMDVAGLKKLAESLAPEEGTRG